MGKFLDLFRRGRLRRQGADSDTISHRKYTAFKKLLAANNSALEIISELESTIFQDKPFTLSYAKDKAQRLLSEVRNIVEDLAALSGRRTDSLFNAIERVEQRIAENLEHKRRIDRTHMVLPLERVSQDNVAEVGGKAANLGEISNRAHLPVPPGFAITAYACLHFLEQNHLTQFIESKLGFLDVNDTEKLIEESHQIRSRILKARIPEDLAAELRAAASELRRQIGPLPRLSVRSSATSEDSEASFAGQHSTVLNVKEENLGDAYREVVASTFNPRAIFYRRQKGYADQDVVMSVACIAMIDARVSGVMYTVDPNDSRHAVLMISAVWGLAVTAVEGSASTDFYQINKSTGAHEISEIADKPTQVRPHPEEGLVEEETAEALRRSPCLHDDELKRLADYALRLENHYGYALDIEWAIDREDRLFILQARPLRRSHRFGAEEIEKPRGDAAPGPEIANPVLLTGGASACDGTAAGKAYIIESDHTLHHVPSGAVIVARQTSPRYVPIMGRILAIITDVGSVTGHMASVAREFRIPTLVGTGNATRTIPHGEEITVDATHRTVYQGFVESLVKKQCAINPMKGSPTYKTLKSALKWIAPLNLTDPKKDNFRPEACETLHDIIRFAHEIAMQEMFRLSDQLGREKKTAVPLKIGLPLNLYIVDLGGGLKVGLEADTANIDQVQCVPLLAVLDGMTHPGVDWTYDVGVQWRGFASMLAESIIRDPMVEGHMGGPNYAVVSESYLNLNSRLGYHFATIDTYCGAHVNDNYITFHFKGGAADIGRRTRRALLIAGILKRLGFKVEQKGDMIRAEIKKYSVDQLRQKLDMLGRLLGSVRLLDMVLSDDRQIEWYVDQFFDGNYTFQTK